MTSSPLLTIAVIVVAILAEAPAAEAQLIASESFDYLAGQSLRGRDGGTGWKGAWFGPANADGITIGGTGLIFPGLAVDGGKCQQDGKDTRLFRHIDASRREIAALVEDVPTGKTFGKDGSTIWIAFLIANTSFPKHAHGGLHLMDDIVLGANYKKTQRVQLGRQNQGEHWKLVRTDQGGPAAGTWEGTVTSDTTVRMLIYRFDFRPGPEEGWMWVDPAPNREPDPLNADLHAPKIADFRFNAVNIGSGGGATFDFDELRIGTAFSHVAPAATNQRLPKR